MIAVTCAVVALGFSIGAFVLASGASTDADEAIDKVANASVASGSATDSQADSHAVTDTTMDMHDEDAGMVETFAFGESAHVDEATRTIDIEAVDVAFQPATIDIALGETVVFRIRNSGEAIHDFTIGDAQTQKKHDREMAKIKDLTKAEGHVAANAVLVQPGETAEIAFTFSAAGEYIYGCHVPGHYAAGMRGALRVTE